MQQTDIFPFWQYKTHGDGNVRPSHAALNGKIFPAGHDIWQRISPPWDWGCRCIVVPLTRRSADALVRSGRIGEQEAKDAHLLPTQIAKPEMFSDREATLIDKAQRLPDGKPLNRTPTWSDSPWSIPGNIHHDWKLIRARYADQPEVLAAFEQWAQKTEIGKGVTVSRWIGEGDAVGADARWLPGRTPKHKHVTPERVEEVRQQMMGRVSQSGTPHENVIKWGGVSVGVVTQAKVVRAAQSFLDMIPGPVSKAAGSLNVEIVDTLPDAPAWYDPATRTMKISHEAIKGVSANDALDVLRYHVWHEMSHWLWFNAEAHPRLMAWRHRLEDHFKERTAQDVVRRSSKGWDYLPDDWIDDYAGRMYPGHGPGVELPSVYLGRVGMGPHEIAGWLDVPSAKETFDLAMSIFGD